jgi:hypothetical protein
MRNFKPHFSCHEIVAILENVVRIAIYSQIGVTNNSKTWQRKKNFLSFLSCAVHASQPKT